MNCLLAHSTHIYSQRHSRNADLFSGSCYLVKVIKNCVDIKTAKEIKKFE